MNNLELGNLAFNHNDNQEFDCPDYVVALLDYLNKELSRVMWNIDQKEYDSPFENTANSFKNDVFEVQAYSWNDDNPTSYNFKYYVGKESNLKDIEISWYKYLGRDTTVNQQLDPNTYVYMFDKCLESIHQMDVDNFKKLGLN